MVQAKVKLISNTNIHHNYFHCILEAGRIAREAEPGQFVNVKLNGNLDPLLRRPLSIHRVRGSKIEILYEVVGKGSQILSQKKTGEYLDIIGPLGNGFSVVGLRLSVLVAGGMGVAPLLFLAEKLTQKPRIKSQNKPLVLIGGKTKNQILCAAEFKKLGCEVKISTDDGSQGFKGYVAGLLKKELLGIDYKLSTIYACGPKPMLNEVCVVAQSKKIPAQISLEEHMACGIGACLGCVVDTKQGFKRVCKDGPVFLADEIV